MLRLIQVGSCARHIVSNLVTGKTGVTGDPLEAQVGSPIAELAQLLPDSVRQDVSLRRRALAQPSECRLGVGADPHLSGCGICGSFLHNNSSGQPL